jgi:hypothetical protein
MLELFAFRKTAECPAWIYYMQHKTQLTTDWWEAPNTKSSTFHDLQRNKNSCFTVVTFAKLSLVGMLSDLLTGKQVPMKMIFDQQITWSLSDVFCEETRLNQPICGGEIRATADVLVS